MHTAIRTAEWFLGFPRGKLWLFSAAGVGE
jgi:hypothetical protein